jgi:hypothetical protein
VNVDSLTVGVIVDALDAVADDVGLGDRDSWAFQAAEQAALSDETTVELAEGRRRLGYALEAWEDDADPSNEAERWTLDESVDDVGGLVEDRVRRVAIERVTDAEIGPHAVDLRRAKREVCPLCSETTSWYFLGHALEDGVECVGWVCGHCESDLLESEDDGQVVVDVDRTDAEVSEA